MTDTKKDSPIRVWIDGCFDLWHYGHANALRQAKTLGDTLVVGIHSDAEITRAKGAPVMTEAERYPLLRAIKWVDEIVEDAPYKTLLSTMDEHRIDFAVHGDDISLDPDGNDSFLEVKKANRFKFIRRTRGVSTTDIVGRMLLLNTLHHKTDTTGIDEDDLKSMSAQNGSLTNPPTRTPVLTFIPTSRKIVQFSSGREPKPTDRVVYVDGAFDMLHAGHTEFFRKARELGDFLVVGVHSDQDVNKYMGANFPILNLHERLLAVLACKYVDEVVIGAPYGVTTELLESMNIGTIVFTQFDDANHTTDQYSVARNRIRVEEVTNDFRYLTSGEIVGRIIRNAIRYQEKLKKKVIYATGEAIHDA